jgi:hypothetical protein
MNNDDSIDDVEKALKDKEAKEANNPAFTRNQEQEAEELRRKVAEIERKVADGN